MDLAYKKSVRITQRELDRMNREEASRTIDVLPEGIEVPLDFLFSRKTSSK